ncbi:WXG100 family type VII secretion target [Mycobacteroides abscessus]|nr:WXG100 family type VII secretion target [Mycobacteroides abscessus]MDM2178628.1 WXG100 family type VII secretion target [Mycobacteroides abscessus]MDM2211642.1 WXG100 family type VII secretion target [Mycobacteroides abscessus]MDM2217544.1 WXG100 family type VII secretion target [Mycobacteroides abscessus]MDM2221979.1 WXG100 family type VII secretion target [Mycobacteroides abscessus]
MSLSVGELKKVSVQSIRDISAGLRAKAASMRATKAGVTDLPHKGTWTGVAADNADHEIGRFATGVGRDAEAYEDAARKVDRAGDEFEGVKQLLAKLENEAAGKFAINEATGEVTPLTKDFNKSDRDYIANTIKQLCAAGGQANDDLAAGIHATDASGATSPAGAAGGPLPLTPNSSIKPDGIVGGMQNLAAPGPEGDPGATKAAAAATASGDTINYKELYPKTTVDGHQLGSVGAVPGVGNIDKTKPAKLAPTLADRDVPAFKDLTRQNLINAKVPADQIEQRVNDAVKAAQAPRFLPDADPMRTPGEVPLHNSPGDQFNDIVGRANDEATKTIDGQIEQAKILTGQAGPGAPGVAEAWKDVGLGAAQQVHELTSDPLAAPKMGIEQAKDFYNHPGEFIGKNLIHGTEALAGGAVGGEAAAGARGLLGDLTGTEGRAITHGLDNPHPTPTVEHGGGGGISGDHTSGVGDHGGGPGGHGMPGGNPTPFDFDTPIDTARPEFNIPNPVEVMSPELRGLVDQHLTGSGETVIGPYAPRGGGPSYIDVAQQRGASYFDIGDAWNSSTPTQQLASNQYALDMAVKNGDTIRLSVPFYRIDPSTFTGAEIRYFESHGYQRMGDNLLIPPRGGTP